MFFLSVELWYLILFFHKLKTCFSFLFFCSLLSLQFIADHLVSFSNGYKHDERSNWQLDLGTNKKQKGRKKKKNAVAPQVVFEGKSLTTMFKTFTSPYHFTKRAGLGPTICFF
jgi:hypothetical protein